MAVVGFDTATADTAVCAMRGGEVLHEALLGLAPDGSPRHSTALLAEVERAAAAAGGWDAVEPDRGRTRAGLLRRHPHRHRHRARAGGEHAACRSAGVCTLDALGRGLGELAGPERSRLAVLDARRGEVFAALYAAGGGAALGAAGRRPRRAGRAGRRAARAAAGGRIGGGTISG